MKNRSLYILGVYARHNATACLLKDGEIVAAASEERFVGIKNFKGFPKKAIDYCLKQAGIKSSQLDLVTIPFKYLAPIHSTIDSEKDSLIIFFSYIYPTINIIRRIWGEFAYRYSALRVVSRLFYSYSTFIVGSLTIWREKKNIAEYLHIDVSKIVTFDHHLCHAASVYYASSFNNQKALVLTADGEGNNYSASVSIFNKDKIVTLVRTNRDSSLGWIYRAVTIFLGMKAEEHEYKVMGLAPYAHKSDIEKYYKMIKDIVSFDSLKFKSKFSTVDTHKFLQREIKRLRFDIVAGIFQKLIEEKTSKWVEKAIKGTALKTVLLSGGVFMNIKANQKIAQLNAVKKFFVVPTPSDESSPIGACFLGLLKLKGAKADFDSSPIKDIYWGPCFSEEEIKSYLKTNKRYRFHRINNIERRIAQLLAKGEIVARIAGRMEFGARALGNRSILADPSKYQNIRIINEQIKGRDFWMPFSPTILEERATDYIVNPKEIASPYMMISFDSTPRARQELVAAIHPADFTLRPQILKKEFNPKYYKIIKEFEKITGIGAVLNTSFNIHGYPIVLGPKEALDAFSNSGLKFLAMENYLIEKR